MGEAAGVAAALAIEKGIRPRALNGPEVRRELDVNRGVNLGPMAAASVNQPA